MPKENGSYLVYVGTYTRREPHVMGQAEGIYLYRMDPVTGGLTHVATQAGIENPSFLVLDPQGRHLYAASEIADFGGEATGAVYAYAVDAAAGTLRLLNRQNSQGAAPCHISIDGQGRCLLAANYLGGSLAVFPIQADGSLGAASQVVHHQGSSVNPRRQEKPHVHSANLSADGRFAFVADLGIDRVMIYRLDTITGKVEPNEPAWVATAPGAGPRHFALHPGGGYAYAIMELNSTLTAYGYDARQGTLTEIQTVSTLPADFAGENTCADVHVSPDGRFVYGSNRGHDSIAIFAVDSDSGHLTAVGHEPTQGRTPRNFAIDPSGRFLLAANQDSSTVTSFRIDPDTGRLRPTGAVTHVPTPVCLQIVEAAAR